MGLVRSREPLTAVEPILMSKSFKALGGFDTYNSLLLVLKTEGAVWKGLNSGLEEGDPWLNYLISSAIKWLRHEISFKGSHHFQ